MADFVAHSQPVLYVDCELSDKQFQIRYTDQDTGLRHIFPENLLRAEIRPEAINARTTKTTSSRTSKKPPSAPTVV